MHKSFVNNGKILSRELSRQLLNDSELHYSTKDGSFVYFNDTLTTQEQNSTKDNSTTVNLILEEEEVFPPNGNLTKDSLFTVIIVEYSNYAEELRGLMRTNGTLGNIDDIEDVKAVYHYSSELSIFNMRNNKKLKERHNVT